MIKTEVETPEKCFVLPKPFHLGYASGLSEG